MSSMTVSANSSPASATTCTTRVLRVRVKDRHAEWLSQLAREVNTVWNYCNDLQIRVFERERKDRKSVV